MATALLTFALSGAVAAQRIVTQSGVEIKNIPPGFRPVLDTKRVYLISSDTQGCGWRAIPGRSIAKDNLSEVARELTGADQARLISSAHAPSIKEWSEATFDADHPGKNGTSVRRILLAWTSNGTRVLQGFCIANSVLSDVERENLKKVLMSVSFAANAGRK